MIIDEKNTCLETLRRKKSGWVIVGVGVILLAFLMIPSASATTWTRSVDYNQEDVREVEFKNWWGLGETQGTATLRSHELDERGEIVTLKVGIGKQVTMHYDFNFNELITNGLGDVEFINMKTGRYVERDWKFVYLDTEIKEREICIDYSETLNKNGTLTRECSKLEIQFYEVEVWKDYNSRDIPKGNLRIGIEVETKQGDLIDGIWNLGSKRLDRHAVWNASLEANLVSWWKMEDNLATTNFIDSHGANNLTGNKNSNAMTTASGKINRSVDFAQGSDSLSADLTYTLAYNKPVAISFWYKPNTFTNDRNVFSYGSSAQGNFIVTVTEKTSGGNKLEVGVIDDGVAWRGVVTSPKVISNGNWYHVAINYYANKTLEIYVDGGDKGSVTTTSSASGTGRIRIGTGIYLGSTSAEYSNNYIDEFAIWNKTLTIDEITILYNEGRGCTYQLCDIPPALEIILLSPENTANLISNNVNFSANVLDEDEIGITNVTIEVWNTDTDTLNFTNTNTSTIEGLYEWTAIGLIDGNYNWTVYAYDGDDELTTSVTRSFLIDTIAPEVEIQNPTPIVYESGTTDIDLNFAAIDENLHSCWYNLEASNVSIPDCDNTTLTGLVDGLYDFYVYANDSAGNEGFSSVGFAIGKNEVMNLTSPANDTETINRNFNFTADFDVPEHWEKVNATLYIWNSTGGIERIQTITDFPTTNITILEQNLPLGIFEWNILGYYSYDGGVNSTFSENNFTLERKSHEVIGESFSDQAYETASEDFQINISTIPEAELFSATLIYDNRSYPGIITILTNGEFQVDRRIDIPTTSINTTREFFWRFNMDVGSIFITENSDTQSQIVNITSITIGGSDLNYTIRDENTLELVALRFKATFEWWLGSGTEIQTDSFNRDPANNFLFQKYPDEIFWINNEIEISNLTGYEQRSFNFVEEEVNGGLTRTLYALRSANGTATTIEVRDPGIAPLSGYLVKVFRYYPEENIHRLVESKRTDIFGQAPVRIIERDVRYMVQFFNQENELIKEERNVFFVCRTVPCVAQFIIKDDEAILERFDTLSDYDYIFRFDDNTNVFEFVWNDNRDESSTHRMVVEKRTFDGIETIFESTSSDNPGIITYTITDDSKATYTSQIYRTSAGRERRVDVLDAKIGDETETFGVEGLLWAAILLLTLILIGVFHPPTGIILYLVGIFLLGMLDLVYLPPGIIAAQIVIGVLVILAFRS